MITITLEGECWRDILREISIIQASVTCSRIEDLPERANPCSKCQADRHNKLMGILGSGYGLGPEEVAEILERVR
jgi:hypothetical protein